MNIANAFSFLVLGAVMQVFPELIPAADAALVVGSVRAEWMEFMSWVIGGIGSTYVLAFGAQRAPQVMAALAPARLPELVRARSDAAELPSGARAGAAN